MERGAIVTGAASAIDSAVIRTVRRLLALCPIAQVRDVVFERTLA